MESMLKKIILVPTDFSEVCANAINQAASAAKLLQYKLVLLHVIDKNTKSFLKLEGEGADYVDKQLESIAANVIAEFGIEVDNRLEHQIGMMFSELAEYFACQFCPNIVHAGQYSEVDLLLALILKDL